MDMPRIPLSLLSKASPVYIPSRVTPGIPSRRRIVNVKQKPSCIEVKGGNPPRSYATTDAVMYKTDLDFTPSLFVVDRLD